MKKEQLAFALNLLCFGALFILIKLLVGTYLPMSYIYLIGLSALLSSIFTPKFMVNNGDLFMKIPLFKKPIKL